MNKKFLRVICPVIAVIMIVLMFAGCGKKTENNDNAESTAPDESVYNVISENTAQTTTAPAETTTEAPQEDKIAIQNIVDILESKVFCLAGTMKITGGQTIEATMNCDGERYMLDILSKQMNISFIYLDGVPYIANNSNKMYAEINEDSMKSVEQIMSSMSNMGISISGADIADMKSMMANFDENMDYSQYIEGGDYSEYTMKDNGEEYLCSSYKTEYGSIKLYTQEGANGSDDRVLKKLEAYDADGLRQMEFIISMFIPQVIAPVALTGLTQTSSIINVFTGK